MGKPHKDVEYLVASVVHKNVLDLLEGHKVRLWHIYSHESSRKGVPVGFPKGEWALTGGSNVGLRCMVLARFLGFRDMVLFGLDCSFRNDGLQHAGWHPKEQPNMHAVLADGKHYYTNPAFHFYAQEFFREIEKLGEVKLEVRGEGLLQAQVRERTRQGQPLIKEFKPAMIAAASPQVISPEYLAMNRQLHEERPDFGMSGSKRAQVVKDLVANTKPANVLDYGCGKGTLAKALPFPIWEYDPAVPGKDSPPRPAELVVCTDVLEHIEPGYLDSVLLDLKRVTLKVCYVLIHTGPAEKVLPDGRNAHLIQESLEWWKARLSNFFEVASLEMQNGVELVGVLSPKKALVHVPPPDFSKRITPFRHNGTEVKFITPNDGTIWRAQTLAHKEKATMDWIESMRPGEVLWDVGANVGGYTVWAAKHRGVKVYAFEPEAQNYALLCRNMVLNGVDGSAYCLALTDKPGMDSLYTIQQEPGGSCNSYAEKIGPDLKAREGIPQGAVGVRADDIQLPAPHHIKIDVDGLEHKVIDGAKGLLSRARSVLLEVNENLPEHVAMVESMKSMGFEVSKDQVDAARRKEGPFKGCAEYVFRRPQVITEVEQYVLDRIRSAEIRHDPFPHVYIDGLFPDDFYKQLRSAIPADGWKSLEEARGTKGYPERSVNKSPEMVAWMLEGRLRDALDQKFGVRSSKDETLLIRDLPGYKITPHTDTPSKVVSMLCYLSGEDGTSLYKPKLEGFTCSTGKHHRADGFDKVWTAPFRPNSAFIFARTDSSFHGVEPTKAARDLLLYDSRK